MKKNFIISIAIVFIVLCGIFLWMRTAYPEYNFTVLIWGNVIMAILSYLSHYLVTKEKDNKPDAFVRGVYSSSFLKLSVCVIFIMVYVLVNRPDVHKPTLYVLMGVYAVYSAVETWLSSKIARQAK